METSVQKQASFFVIALLVSIAYLLIIFLMDKIFL
jgi:hypothetical protein